MKVSVLLNPGSGSLRQIDIHELRRRLRASLEHAGHEIVFWHDDGGDIELLLQTALEQGCDTLLIGGGDGSVSAAARVAWQQGLALAILPGGTMNLYSRTLGLPLDVMACADAYGQTRTIKVDVATLGDRVFLHQFTVGLHARAIRLRDTMAYGSRWSKMLASVRAFLRVALKPPRLKVDIDIDGNNRGIRTVSALSVTNNLLGAGHMPYADQADGGVLGLYYTDPVRYVAGLRLVIDIMSGQADTNPHLHEDDASHVRLAFVGRRRRQSGMLDGELVKLDRSVELTIHPRALTVMLPAGADVQAIATQDHEIATDLPAITGDRREA